MRVRQSATWQFAAPLLLLVGCAETMEPQRQSTIRVYSERVYRARAGSCGQMSWPVDGPLSSLFGVRDGRPHEGIDLAVAEGTPVHAACDGVVAYAGDKLRGYGRLVIVQHADKLVTIYAHNRALQVKEGDPVARGQTLALSGQTGHATAPHVHFEVRQDNRPDDPLKYLPPRALAVRGLAKTWGRGDSNGPAYRLAHRPHP